eukprot:snap_masked-scaffold_3-processed-gene-4.28-mRNA-1 protein AED:1.00 eAED:1.00 QI:0/0/0/0/1/1/2/0/102
MLGTGVILVVREYIFSKPVDSQKNRNEMPPSNSSYKFSAQPVMSKYETLCCHERKDVFISQLNSGLRNYIAKREYLICIKYHVREATTELCNQVDTNSLVTK